MRLEGLTEFQRDLLKTAQQTPKKMKKTMGKVGTKATAHARKRGRRDVKKKTGNYHKKWKRGKVFNDSEKKIVVRVLNTSPHGHLVEDGHIQVVNPPKPDGKGVIEGKGIGRAVGFVPGKKVLEKSMDEFDNSGEQSKIIGEGLDELLRENKL